jgi:AP-1 complex subunit beta-1
VVVCNTILFLQAAKDVVLAEKPTINDDSNNLDPTLLDELLANIATLASVYHKRADAFVTRARAAPQRDDDDEYIEGQDSGSGNSSAPVPEMAPEGPSAPSTSAGPPPAAPKGPVPSAAAAAPVPAADLLGDLMGFESALVPVGPATSPVISE